MDKVVCRVCLKINFGVISRDCNVKNSYNLYEEAAVLSSIVSSQPLGIHDSEDFFRKPGRINAASARAII